MRVDTAAADAIDADVERIGLDRTRGTRCSQAEVAAKAGPAVATVEGVARRGLLEHEPAAIATRPADSGRQAAELHGAVRGSDFEPATGARAAVAAIADRGAGKAAVAAGPAEAIGGDVELGGLAKVERRAIDCRKTHDAAGSGTRVAAVARGVEEYAVAASARATATTLALDVERTVDRGESNACPARRKFCGTTLSSTTRAAIASNQAGAAATAAPERIEAELVDEHIGAGDGELGRTTRSSATNTTDRTVAAARALAADVDRVKSGRFEIGERGDGRVQRDRSVPAGPGAAVSTDRGNTRNVAEFPTALPARTRGIEAERFEVRAAAENECRGSALADSARTAGQL